VVSFLAFSGVQRCVLLLMSRIGPGDSKDDVKWLDDNLREFFASNDSKIGGK
jgi:hypothetical protein